MKQKYEFKNVVAETLLIPLYMRAKPEKRRCHIERHDGRTTGGQHRI